MSTSETQKRKYAIGVVGTGEEGTALINKLTQLGHDVCIAHAGSPEALKGLEKQTQAKPKETAEVAKEADLLFLSIPMKEVQNLPKELTDTCPKNCIIVDVCNYFPSRDGKIKEIEDGMPESVWVSKQLGKPVIKALNTILTECLENCGRPKNASDRIAVPISGDDPTAKNMIVELVDSMGFDAYDAGDLALSWRLQPGSPVYGTNLDLKQLIPSLSRANKEAMPRLRDEAYRKMTESDKHLNWQEMVKMLRETFEDQEKELGKSELNKSSATSGGQQNQQQTQQQAASETQA